MKRETRRVVPCRIENDLFAFSAGAIRSITQGLDCRQRPFAEASGLVGETLFDRQSIPVFGLREMLGYAKKAEEDEQLLVIDSSQGSYGVLTDHVHGAQNASAVFPLPKVAQPLARNPYRGIAKLRSPYMDDEPTRRLAQSPDGEGGLLLCPEGLLGMATEDRTDFDAPPLETSLPSASREGQLILFHVPHRLVDDQVISIALSATQVLEVAMMRELMQVPRSPNGFFGLIPWRSHFVPIVDVTSKLSLGTIPEQARERIVIARMMSGELIGFFASNNIRTLRMPIEASAYEIEDIPEHHCISGSFSTRNGIIVLPALDALAEESASPYAA